MSAERKIKKKYVSFEYEREKQHPQKLRRVFLRIRNPQANRGIMGKNYLSKVMLREKRKKNTDLSC